jgi:excinuclease ABC subunit A
LSGSKAIPVPTNRRVAHLASGAPAIHDSSNHKAGPRRQQTPDETPPPATAAPAAPPLLTVRGARHNNLRNIDVSIPLGTLTAVTGVSGGGKSSLVDDVLYATLARTLHRAHIVPGAHESIEGFEHINKVIRVDQRALGNSPSSNPATYTGAFDLIRQLYAQLPDSKLRGYSPRRFSFNVPGSRCEACEGNGQKRIEMHFLPDVWVQCDTCRGRRYDPETLAVKFHGQSIADCLEMTCAEAVQLMGNVPKIRRILQTLCDVGLDYLTLGQPAPTLSGGEAQRVKLAAELARPDTGRTLYLLDEPTTGLHFDDLAKLLDVLHRLVDLGNTVVVIEHNLDVIKSADFVIDMGPEAGSAGGRVVTAGTPEDVVQYARKARDAAAATAARQAARSAGGKAASRSRRRGAPSGNRDEPTLYRSHTGEVLEPVLAAGPHVVRRPYDPHADRECQDGDLEIEDVGRHVKMPWEIDGRRWHCQDRVGRNGQPCRWDGRILQRVVDYIQEAGDFSETNWNARGVVEITGQKKSAGWFFHAITGENWLLKLKFRVLRSTFQREDLQQRLGLSPLNQIHELPVYGNEPRVRCKNLRGPWQEVEVRTYTLEEVDTPAFWQFVQDAIAGFRRFTERADANPEDIMPWKKLGEKWHFARRGFPTGRRVKWEPQILQELFDLLRQSATDGQFLWTNQQVVHLYVPEQKEPWATVWTKRPEAVRLVLTGPKGNASLGRVAGLGRDRAVESSDERRDVIRLRFQEGSDLKKGDLPHFLREHRAGVRANGQGKQQ